MNYNSTIPPEPYNYNIFSSEHIINNLTSNNQYLYSQLSSAYQKNANLEYQNKNITIKLDKLRNEYENMNNDYNKLDHSYETLDKLYKSLDKDYSKLLNTTSKKHSLDTDETSNNENNKIYKKHKHSLSDERIHELISNLKNIEDIINLPKDTLIRHNADINKLLNIRKPLEKLNNMIGLDSIKNELFKHIIYFIINKESIYENNRLHTVIQGPPGVGKTEFGKILSEVYLGMGFLKNNIFKMVKRSDLIGQYLGQTAIKTQKVIDEIIGGVLFIDEAYSLGNSEKRDSYSKECLDTINRNLTENGNKFICIVAGYEKDLQECFFNSNSGLERRFTFKYNIDGYSSDELMEIFLIKCKVTKWKCDINRQELSEFFNQYKLPYFAGDIDRLLFQSQLIASLRIFKENKKKYSKNIILNDIKEGILSVVKNLPTENTDDDTWKKMYM
tara:strand:+ start:1578 stop:2912 length:1335 start_codon:yes stop_codon:yes gene_type:complete